MNKITIFTLGVLLTVGANVYAEGTPSAKATAKVGNVAIIDSTAKDWTTILSNTIKTANQKDLIIDVSLESGLYTQTLVRSKTGTKDTSTANASIKVRVLVDGVPVYPSEVVFAARNQELSGTLGGILSDCVDTNNDGIVSLTECTIIDEEINLVLNTMNANGFNFLFDDLKSGVHYVQVQARIDTGTTAQTGSATAKATIGNGSMTVEEVRMIQNEDILL